MLLGNLIGRLWRRLEDSIKIKFEETGVKT
jgi:hypothetical protein